MCASKSGSRLWPLTISILACQGRACQAEGLPERGIPRWIPFLVPTESRAKGRYTKPKTLVPPALWPEIHERYASGESLRELAQCYGVSHETLRALLQRLIQGVA
jgi:hypothetical protein